MTKSEFWRSFSHGHGLAALFVDLKPSTVKDEKLAALYTFNARCGAGVLLCVVVGVSWYLAHDRHPWAAVAVIAMTIMMTIGQLLNHRADHEAD